MNKKLQRIKYIAVDIITAEFIWIGFFLYRQYSIDPNQSNNFYENFTDKTFWYGFVLYPLFWYLIYIMAGMYRRVYKKTRLVEVKETAGTSIIGMLILFFFLILEDPIFASTNQTKLFFIFLFSQFLLTYIGRLSITHPTIKKIHARKIGFNTLLIGSGDNALNVFGDLENQKNSSGNKFIGFVNAEKSDKYKIESILPYLGSISDLPQLIDEYAVEEVVIAIEKSESKFIISIINELEFFDVVIKIIPLFHDYIFGKIKTTGMYLTPFIEISPDLMPAWQFSVKRILDISFSILAIVFLIPIFIIVAFGVKLSSPGSIIFTQERVGKNGRKFKMIKFRSMYSNAEDNGPQLSSKIDPRTTKFGAFIRKLRIDEIPQFFIILKGDMSIVGPRPEREYFINQIVERAPHFKLMQKVKPGMTSWGQVKFGYAENIEEMIVRMQYDILYLENMSLAMDFKIMIWTVLIVFQGRGK